MAYQTLYEMMRKGQVQAGHRRSAASSVAATAAASARGCTRSCRRWASRPSPAIARAQLFEIVGLVERGRGAVLPPHHEPHRGCRTSTISRATRNYLAMRAWNPRVGVEQGGLYKYVHGGEYHMYNPDVVGGAAGGRGRRATTSTTSCIAQLVNQPAGLDAARSAGLQGWRARRLPLEEVEPLEAVLARFDGAGMSLGRALARGARGAGDRDEPPGRPLQFRRGRRGSGALRHREELQDQAGGLGTLRRHARVPDQCRGAADQDRAGRQARRGRTAARATRSTR